MSAPWFVPGLFRSRYVSSPVAPGWRVRSVIVPGQPGYGMAAVGADKVSAGANAILAAAERDDPRPLWITVWGGANTLAQALLTARATRAP